MSSFLTGAKPILVAVALLLTASDVTVAEGGELNAQQVLERSTAVYRAAETYVDTGVVETVYITGTNERIGTTRFKTAYVAPRDFRFESRMNDFGGPDVVFAIGQNAAGVEAWFSSQPSLTKDIDTVQAAIDTGAGVSRDTTTMVPGILFPGSKLGGDIVELTDVTRRDDEVIDKVDCYRLEGFRWPNTGSPTTVWIDKETFLIRRVYEEQDLRNLQTRTTWTFRPQLNEPVPADALHFDLAGFQ